MNYQLPKHFWPTTPPDHTVEQKFQRLVDDWKSASEFYSSSSKMAMLPSYQQIIGMGPIALPFILRELEREADHWFWALKAIAGEDPVPESDCGDVKKMARAWLDWGRARGIQW